MKSAEIDRNLLFGVIALQDDLIDRDQFADVCAGWALSLDRALADLLVERGWITDRDRAEVDRKLRRKLGKHRGDVRVTLGAVADSDVRDAIRGVDSSVIRASLQGLPPAAGYVFVETLPPPPTTEQRSRYTLTRLHAEGGLGKVWVARDRDLNREVALKEIKPRGEARKDAWRRFLKEAQITGQLEHPNIVPVYELARRPEDDQPYYVMRLIRGQTFREAIAGFHRRGDWASDRLELQRLLTAFISVCQAIGYAHSRGVVHRDLKPENIVLGAFGEVIVLDWGLAKMIDQPDADRRPGDAPALAISPEAETGQTQGQVGTPAYMAPEQVEARHDLIDARTDVYALGGVLFEILTGRPPVEGATAAEVFRKVLSGAIPRPREVVPETPRPLDAICSRALARDRAARYARPTDLAEDVRRWIADEPVSAWREPWAYRARRWTRRNRSAMLAGSTAALVLVVGLGALNYIQAQANVVLAQSETRALKLAEEEGRERRLLEEANGKALAQEERALALAEKERLARIEAEEAKQKIEIEKRHAEAERQKAEKEKRTAQRTRDFLVDLFDSSDPIGLHGIRLPGSHKNANEVTARELIDQAAGKVDGERLDSEPGVRAAVLESIGHVYRSMALYEEAIPRLKKAVEILRAQAEPDDLALANALQSLAWLHHDRARYEEALPLYEESLAIRRRRLGEDHPETVNSLFHIAWILADQGDPGRAEPLFRRIIASRSRPPVQERELALAHLGLAGVLIDHERFVEAIPSLFVVVPWMVKQSGSDESLKALTLFQQGVAANRLGRLERAEGCFRESLKIARKGLGGDHPYLAFIHYELARTQLDRRRPSEGELSLWRSFDIVQRSDNMAHPRVALLVGQLAFCLKQQGRHSEANFLFDEMIAARRRRYRDDHPRVADAIVDRLFSEDDLAAQFRLAREAMAIYERHPDYRSEDRIRLTGLLANLLLRREDPAAEGYFRRLIDVEPGSMTPAEANWNRARGLGGAGAALALQERAGEAEELIHQSLALFESKGLGSDLKRWVEVPLGGLARLRADQGRLAEAVEAATKRLPNLSGDPAQLYSVAAFVARCADRAEGDDRRAFEAKAIDALRLAVDSDFADFRRAEGDFDKLNDREGVRELTVAMRDRACPSFPFPKAVEEVAAPPIAKEHRFRYDYVERDGSAAVFVQTGPREWENEAHGHLYRFEEVARTDSSIILHDPSRSFSYRIAAVGQGLMTTGKAWSQHSLGRLSARPDDRGTTPLAGPGKEKPIAR